MQRLIPLEKDYYLDDDDAPYGNNRSGDDDSGSSDDEIQRMFADIAGVQLPSQRKRQMTQERSFEAEMEKELNESFNNHNASWSGGRSAVSATIGNSSMASPGVSKDGKKVSQKSSNIKNLQQQQANNSRKEDDCDPALGLNDEATESDEEFEKSEGMKRIDDSNVEQDILYDPDEDEANQSWVDSHRRSYQPNATQHKALPKSDAVLNCPACMTVLCLDCQRHEVYKTQYRAMFAVNCDVKRSELLYQPTARKRGGVKKRKADQLPGLKSGDRFSSDDHDVEALEDIKRNSRPEDLFYPVVCGVCKTEVGVYDSDEIYHFFNVLASYA